MVGTTKLKSQPAVVTTPKTAPIAPPVAKAAARPAAKPDSNFDAEKKKKGNLTGAFKPVARAKPASVQLSAEVKSIRSAAAVNGAAPAKADAKVSGAAQRLAAKTPATAKDLIAENAKLTPAQQHELKLALPDKLRLALDAELAKMSPDQRGPQITWMGDKNLPGVGKDGYIAVTVGPTVLIKEDGGTTKIKYASKIDLGNGKSITATPHGNGDLLVKYGNQTLKATRVVGGWQFSELTRSPRDGDTIDHEGKAWRPLNTANKDQALMITAFREGGIIAGDFGARLDPGTEQIFRDRAIEAAIPGAREAITKLSQDAATYTGFVQSSAEWVATNQKWLAPAVKAGHIGMTQNKDGSVSLELTRPSGMRDSEWKKIQAEFGPKVAQFAERLSNDQKWLSTQLYTRDTAAYGALNTFNGPSFQKYLATLPPRERLDEVMRLSQSLKGSGAGVSLANELFGAEAFKVGANGKLEPATPLAKSIFEGARTPEAIESLKQLALSLGPQLSMSGAASLARSLEIVRGEPLNTKQRAAVDALHAVKTPEDFKQLTDPDPKSAPSVLDKAGDVSDLLAELGSASGADKLGSATNKVVKGASDLLDTQAARLTRGSAYVATFQVFNSTKDLLQKGVTVDTAAAFAEDATRAIGTWGAVMEAAGKTGYLSKVGKFAGPVSDAIGLVNDMRRESSSAEGAYRNNVHVGASALILGGGLVGCAGGPRHQAGLRPHQRVVRRDARQSQTVAEHPVAMATPRRRPERLQESGCARRCSFVRLSGLTPRATFLHGSEVPLHAADVVEPRRLPCAAADARPRSPHGVPGAGHADLLPRAVRREAELVWSARVVRHLRSGPDLLRERHVRDHHAVRARRDGRLHRSLRRTGRRLRSHGPVRRVRRRWPGAAVPRDAQLDRSSR
jgi:hypothetical protein